MRWVIASACFSPQPFFDQLVADMVEADRLAIRAEESAVIATAELRRFLYANSNDWYRLCRTRVWRMLGMS